MRKHGTNLLNSFKTSKIYCKRLKFIKSTSKVDENVIKLNKNRQKSDKS
jgi:hypothetical protein